ERSHLYSFPTRRSSDLCFWVNNVEPSRVNLLFCRMLSSVIPASRMASSVASFSVFVSKRRFVWLRPMVFINLLRAISSFLKESRSEEHTSELQSRENLV